MRHLGREGYVRLAAEVLEATRRIAQGVGAIEGLRVLGRPEAGVVAFTSDTVDVLALGDAMAQRGWHLDRQQMPPALHMILSPVHRPLGQRFLSDLAEAAAGLRDGTPAPEGQAAMYGMLGAAPDRGMVRDFMLDLMDSLYQPGA
jgi:glutamate/tyrosine decarboxylase-like PLP-dependent enzyme